MKRGFEKISFEQFSKDVSNDKKLYNEYNLPKRQTKYSAGYDFFAIYDFVIKPGEVKKIPTGVKVWMQPDEMLMIVNRSSVGFKYNVRLCNQVGIIESDYYNNIDNEGHIWIAMQNHGDKDFTIKKGEHFVQGIFTKFLVVDDEDEILNERTGGLGSTN
ncbi:MAG: deoxyuridine 5'-triphosphate nucleotidohydrolase [Mollicutes bacterium]|nr:deoxyuridine 5'-triphosphate nucleotidohydrolase [Mollicutes bacterium]